MDNFEAQRQISAAFREGIREGRTQLIREFAEVIGYDGNVSVVKGLLSGELEVGHIEIDGFRNSKEIQTIEKVEMSND